MPHVQVACYVFVLVSTLQYEIITSRILKTSKKPTDCTVIKYRADLGFNDNGSL